MLGTNGGGFFNANSAHPFENPTPLTNLLQIVAIFSLGAALTYMFGRMVRRRAPGLGDLRRDGRCCSSSASPSATGPRADGNPLRLVAVASTPRSATWRARRSASASRNPRCSPP